MSVARRLAAGAALVLTATGLAATAPAGATSPALTYSCHIQLPPLDVTFTMTMDTNVPTPFYVGWSRTPVMTTKASIPADTANQVASTLGADTVDGTTVSTIRLNGVNGSYPGTIAKQSVPPGNTNPVVLTATTVLPRLAPTRTGSMTYTPGNVAITLTFSKGATKKTSFSTTCVLDPATPAGTTIDKVVFVKSASRLTPAVAYAKKAKRVTAVGKVAATSGVAPTGSVVATLFKGTSPVKVVVVPVKGGKATAVFGGVKKKGAYKVLLAYTGSAAVNASTASKGFAVR